MDILEIRELYSKSATDSNKAKQLYEFLNSQKDLAIHPLFLAYLGAAEAIKANNEFFPFTKLGYIQQAMRTFQKAVSLAPDLIEIRFLRFTIQHNMPFFLGMNGDLDDDKKMILSHLEHSTEDKDLLKAIAKYLLESGRCTFKEKAFLKDYLEKNI